MAWLLLICQCIDLVWIGSDESAIGSVHSLGYAYNSLDPFLLILLKLLVEDEELLRVRHAGEDDVVHANDSFLERSDVSSSAAMTVA